MSSLLTRVLLPIAVVVLSALAVGLFVALLVSIIRFSKTKQNSSQVKSGTNCQEKINQQTTNSQDSTKNDDNCFAQEGYAKKTADVQLSDDCQATGIKSFANWTNISLAERLKTLSVADKALYQDTKKLLKRDNLINHTTRICEVYFIDQNPAARLVINRGLIYLFLSLSPEELDKEYYQCVDVSDNEGFEMLPTSIIVRDAKQFGPINELLDKL